MFLVITEDLKWCKKNLLPFSKNVIIIQEKGTALEDFALTASGSSVIMSVGTYGLWAAILSGGEIAFPANKITKKSYYVLDFLKTSKNKRFVGIHWKD